MSDPIRVLVVDEDAEVLELTETFLERERESFVVETELSAREALDRVREGGVDCVVSDYRMPGMNGLELFEAVRDVAPALPFVLFSAAVEADVVAAAEATGVTAFVTKGSGTDHYSEIAAAIEDALDGG